MSEVEEFYTNDVVYRFDKRKRISFGMVLDSYEGSTDSEDFDTLQRGQIRVWWLNSYREQVWRQSRVRLMSRSVIPGDVVRRIVNGKETQRGYCKASKQYVTVQVIGTDKIIERVPSTRLSPCNPHELGAAVCIGNKYGRIQNTDKLLTMKSKCGSTVSVLASINHDIEDYWLSKRKRISFYDCYYPGQQVVGYDKAICTPSNLEQPIWINRSKSLKKHMHARHHFTIKLVEPANVSVLWFEFTPTGFNTTTADLKPEEIKTMKMLDTSDTYPIELLERRLLEFNSSDIIIKKRDWIRKQSALHRPGPQKVKHVISRSKGSGHKFRGSFLPKCTEISDEGNDSWSSVSGDDTTDSSDGEESVKKKLSATQTKDMSPGSVIPVEVLCMDSKATIVWQDGTEEKDVPTTQLYYSMSLDDHEFFPGEWVIDDKQDVIIRRFGVVQHANYLERTATVKWFKQNESDSKTEFLCETEMSVYDLKKHPKYAFRPGIIVKSNPTEENKMGTVLDSCPQGYVTVLWIDGTKEDCAPQNIELVPDYADFSFSMSDSEEDDAVSWETESIESLAGDVTDSTSLQNIASRLDFIRNRIVYLKEAFRQHTIDRNFNILRDLLTIYDNSSYLDKLLDTSFFSLKSKHFQALLQQVKERFKNSGVELKGRLFTSDHLSPSTAKVKVAEKENFQKIIKLEQKVQVQIDGAKDAAKKESGDPIPSSPPTTPLTPDSAELPATFDSLCIELLSMLKVRMDLAYAEIISRIGGNKVFSVMTLASDNTVDPTAPSPVPPGIPITPDNSFSELNPLEVMKPPSLAAIEGVENNEAYALLDQAPTTHYYFHNSFEPTDKSSFYKAVHKECKLLQESLPSGVWVRCFSNRIDLLSVMIRGPDKTPYEDGLFLFDLQLSSNYPRSPPLCHYISYTSERLNPNLYVEGKVCVSLLGTWMGRGTEVWGPNSTLLQLIVSIQGLILVSEPYYNEAGYEKQLESQQGCENSKTYNEFVILKLVQSQTQLLQSPMQVFEKEIIGHFKENGEKMCRRLSRFCDDDPLKPDFPLLPVSKGFKVSLTSLLVAFQQVLKQVLENAAK